MVISYYHSVTFAGP